jgi:anti-sigma regulatory factor (Ser/Thr protein kinase)
MRQLQLPVDPQSVTAARRFIARLDLPEPPRENASLLISELVSNAIVHGDLAAEDNIEVLIARDDALRVEVCHAGEGFEVRPRERAKDDIGGWGLPLVDALADDWGVRAARGMTCVWFSCSVEAP